MSDHAPFLAGAACLFLLSGCGAVDSVATGIDNLNPFTKSEKTLPGERQPVFPTETTATEATQVTTALAIAAPSQRVEWPQSGGPITNNPGHVAMRSGGTVGRSWQSGSNSGFVSSIGSVTNKPRQRVYSRPVVGGGRVFVYSPDGLVTALSLSSGGSAWKTSLKPEKERDIAAGGGVAYDNGVVYAATGYGSLTALNATNGAQSWTLELDSPARSAPAAGAGKVFVVTHDNTVVAVNQSDGTEVWRFDGLPEMAGLLSASNPAISGNLVVVPYRSGEVVAFNIESGEPVWNDAVARASRTWAISGLNDVSASPVIADGVVYATGVGGRLIAVKLQTGERVWEADVGSTHTPVVSGNGVFLVSVDSRVIGFDRQTGEVAWSRQLPLGKKKKSKHIWAGPTLAGNALWFVSTNGQLASVDPRNGSILSITKMSNPSYISPIAVSGRLLVVSSNGAVVSYQ